MSKDIKSDVTAPSSVQEKPPLLAIKARSPFTDSLDAIDAALEAGDVAALQALAPGLTKAGATSVLYHHQQQAWRLKTGLRDYGAQAWGATPPLRLLQGTLALRLAVLRAWRPELAEADARRVVLLNMGDELAQNKFWRLPISTLNIADERAANSLLHGRRVAMQQEMLHHFGADLARIHAATVELLSEAGLPWELLASYAEGSRGHAGAIEQRAQAEASDVQIFGAYLPAALRG